MNLHKRVALMSIYDNACAKYNVGRDKYDKLETGREYSDQDREEIAKFIINCLMSPLSEDTEYKVMKELTREWHLEEHEAKQFIKFVFECYLSKIGPLNGTTASNKKLKNSKSR